MKKLSGIVMVLVFLLTFLSVAHADLLQTLGEQDFNQNDLIDAVSLGTAGIGEPFPFDGTLFGSDPGGTFGDFSYTHNFSLGGMNPIFATLTIGLLDHDSFDESQDTIDIYFDGIQQDDSGFLGISINPASASVVTMPVDISLLLDDSLTIRVVAILAAQESIGNSLAVDFSTLYAKTDSVPVPEPATLLLLGVGLLGMAGFSRRKVK